MRAPTIGERISLAQLRTAAGFMRLRRQATVPWDFIVDLIARPPTRLLIAPQDIRTADPTKANDIYSGYFAFAAKIVDVHGGSPFLVASPSPEWETALMGFGWLRHLRAADTALAKANARALIEEWLKSHGRPSMALAWKPKVAARRLMSWLSHSPLILEGADAAFYRRFMRCLGRHIAWLRRDIAGAKGDAQLFSALALMSAALCTDSSDGQIRRASRRLASALNRQILIDGGHIGRNPQTIVDVLLDLLPLRQAFVARNVTAPAEMNNAIDRMMPMLRLFRHTDGALGLFNGMGLTAQDELLTALAYDDARAQPLLNAIATGYQRLEGENLVVICDTGAPPPRAFSSEAHAGTLSFEMSVGIERLIVNCGAPAARFGPLRQAARFSAAHSTLIIEDVSSSRLAGMAGPDELLEGCILSGPRLVSVDRHDSEDHCEIAARHDGYGRTFGLLHQRTLRVARNGERVEGFDRLLPSGKKGAGRSVDFAIRFHLHPQVKVGLVENGRAALLVTPNGQQWAFHASGYPLSIEDSAFFASPEGTRNTSQIVLSGKAKAGDGIDWVLMKKD